jgi:hypothetical protein
MKFTIHCSPVLMYAFNEMHYQFLNAVQPRTVAKHATDLYSFQSRHIKQTAENPITTVQCYVPLQLPFWGPKFCRSRNSTGGGGDGVEILRTQMR